MGPVSRALALVRSAEELESNVTSWAERGIRSPWAGPSSLSRVVALDIFGTQAEGELTRAECMSIPAIARARHKLVTAVARGVLRQLRGQELVTGDGPAWLSSTSGRTSPQHRLVWTVDDLIFGGWSLWAVTRETIGDPTSRILDGSRAPFDSWQINSDTHEVELWDGEQWIPVEDESSVILIPGYHEGLLSYGTRTIRGAAHLEATAAAQAANPIPAVELHQTTDDEMTQQEIKDLVSDWTTAVTSNGGAVAYTPKSIEVKPHGQANVDLLIQGRNAAAIDAARMIGLPAATIDASNVNSTLTYETTEGRNLEYREDSVSLYADPIAARLSMDDVCPPGERVAFDFGDLTVPNPATTGPARED